MTGLRLKRVDWNHDIPLVGEEIVIGRGPLLECNDKRVSRTHARLRVLDDSVHLTSIHTNPCFYRGGDGKAIVLPKDHSVTLRSGDQFAFVPDGDWFVVQQNDGELSNQQTGDESAITSTVPESIDINCTNKKDVLTETRINATEEECNIKEDVVEQQTIKEHVNTSETSSSKLEQTEKENTGERRSKAAAKRILPSWMVNEPSIKTDTGSVPNKSEKKKSPSKRKAPQLSTANGTSNEEKRQKPEFKENIVTDATTDGNVEEEKEVEFLEAVNKERLLHDISDDDDDDDELGMIGGQEQVSSSTERNPSNCSTEEQVAAGQMPSQLRPLCTYRESCYRKNPQHRQDFSHPGDPDYVVPTDLPACPYGTICYRKNLLHKQQYDHSKPPQRSAAQKARRRAAGRREAEDSSEGDYDYDDLFLNDGSSDDYQPTDSEESDASDAVGSVEEDNKRLLKEAKKFVKKKR